MTRGNWQKRVERTEARRTASKLQKEQRRNKRHSSDGNGRGGGGDNGASYRQLVEWLDENGDSMIRGGGSDFDAALGDAIKQITVDIWTDARPENRPEYFPNTPLDDKGDPYTDDFDDGDRIDKGKSKGKKPKERKRGHKKSKGRTHPNANNKFSQENDASVGRERSGSMSQYKNHSEEDRLCGQEFFFGKEKCKRGNWPQRQKGGRKGRSDSFGGNSGDYDGVGCILQHYHQLPKIKHRKHQKAATSFISEQSPLTLNQVLNEKFTPYHVQHTNSDVNTNQQQKPMASLPKIVREATLKSSFNAVFDGTSDSSASPCMGMVYHARFLVDDKVESKVKPKAECHGSSDNGSHENNVSDSEEGSDNNSSHSNEHEKNDTIIVRKMEIHTALQTGLEQCKLHPTALVYLSIQGILVYDRHRGGLVLSSNEERFLFFGEAVVADTNSGHDENNFNDDGDVTKKNQNWQEPMHIHEQLTHHLLDEILSYAGDEAVATLPQVCTSWREEVGTRSPQLWKMLLGRHGWPSSVEEHDDDDERDLDILGECQRCRSAFVSHYAVARDARAVVDACNYIAGDNGGGKHHGIESALQIFKATKGAPVINDIDKSRCIVKIWSEDGPNNQESASTRALAVYPDFTMRLFEVNGPQANSGKSKTKCRQIVCVRASPPSLSRRKDRCELLSMNLDDDFVACFLEEHASVRLNSIGVETSITIPWMTIFSREDVACAGNKGMLDDECVKLVDLREAVLDSLLNFAPDGSHDELREAYSTFLAKSDAADFNVQITVTPNLVACGKGHFLFHAFIHIPGGEDDPWGPRSCRGHRLFLLSARSRTIANSIPLERHREGTSLFASRPFKRRASGNISSLVCTNVLISGPTHTNLFISVQINRDGTIHMAQPSRPDQELAPWSKINAALTSSHTIFSSDPVQGLFLHFHELNGTALHSIQLGGPEWNLLNIFIIRKHYVAVIIGNTPNLEHDEDAFDGHWFGDDDSSFEMRIYHIPTRREMLRSQVPSQPISVDSIGGTLAINVSNLGFIITGENARDVARTALNDSSAQIGSPSGKNRKSKKKRLASLASGRKKDGFARGITGHHL